MIFLSLIVFIPTVWWLPWWSVWIASAILGLIVPGGRGRLLQVTLACTGATLAEAFICDGRNFGVIGQRMSALFSFGNAAAIYLVLAVIAATSAALGYRFGVACAEARQKY